MNVSCGTVSVLCSVETKDEAGELLSVNQFSTFIVGAGGFGGKRSSQHAKVYKLDMILSCLIYMHFHCSTYYMYVYNTHMQYVLCTCMQYYNDPYKQRDNKATQYNNNTQDNIYIHVHVHVQCNWWSVCILVG